MNEFRSPYFHTQAMDLEYRTASSNRLSINKRRVME